jgi:hypothetical protein
LVLYGRAGEAVQQNGEADGGFGRV